MENIQKTPLEDSLQEGNMARVLVTTIHSSDSIILLSTRLSAERIYLIIDKNADETQRQSLEDIKKTFGKVLEVKEKKVDSLDIVSTTQAIIDLIDEIGRA